MANETVAAGLNESYLREVVEQERKATAWMPSNRGDGPRDTFDRKLYQAEMLAHSIVCDDFLTFNDKIQNGVLCLLADLITEAREAKDEAEAAARQAQP